MKRVFEALRENLDEFVVQNDYPVLVVGCLPEELAYVAKFLQALDEKHPADFFVIFSQRFTSAGPYLDSVVAHLHEQLKAANEVRAARKEPPSPPLPPLPPQVADPRQPPEQRLFNLLNYLPRLLPNEDDHRVVVGFLPLECASIDGYGTLMTSFMPTADFPPWMKALRVVVYDDRAQKRMASAIQARKVKRVLAFDVDFSTPALSNALSVDAVDTSLPIAERMASMLQLAALDYSYKRYADALSKYGMLFDYYETAEVPSMQALCLVGAGDTLRASGRSEEAKTMLQRAIAFALQNKALAAALNALISIVEVCFELGHHEEAESYADSGAQVAAGVLNPYPYADLYERKGDAQMAQRKRTEAYASYQKCRDLCRMYRYAYRAESVLPKLIAMYGDEQRVTDQRDAERELAEFGKGVTPKGAHDPSHRPAQPPDKAVST